MSPKTCLSAVVLLSWLAGASTLLAQGTNAFTYQGRLFDGTNLANGLYDLRFTIYSNASSAAVVAPITLSPVGVTSSWFTVVLNFGAGVFTGPPRWLGIEVKTNGAASFIALSPYQQITPTPYAIMANSASNLLGTLPAGQLAGAVGNSQLANSSVTVSAGTGLSGGGAVALGGSTTLNNAGVLTVTGNADLTASPGSGNVGLSTTATDANTASRIVKRDASGNFSAGSVTLAGNLNLPATTAAAGAITSGGNQLLHAYGTQNTFVGPGAGNFTMGNANNTGVGYFALNQNVTGYANTADGATALSRNTFGRQNTAVGLSALFYNTNGSDNTACGVNALVFNTSGSNNIALGYQAGYNLTTGSGNIDIGNPGIAGEYKRTRIGTQGSQTNTFIAGIYEATVASGTPVYVDSTGQLGTGGTVPATALANAWKTSGNASTPPGANFIGTSDNQPLEFKVNNVRALRIEPSASGPNLVGGNSDNSAAGADASVIGGGFANVINPSVGAVTISGGRNNVGAANFSTVGGGWGNQANGVSAAIGGGFHNTAGGGNSTVAGGNQNIAGGDGSFIGGGVQNTNLVGATNAVIGGGQQNTVGWRSFVGGGWRNYADTEGAVAGGEFNAATGSGGNFIGGGAYNYVSGWQSSICGGTYNRVGNNEGFVGGGHGNSASGARAFIGGGGGNAATGRCSVVAGGGWTRGWGVLRTPLAVIGAP